jgi:hypothetical protein
VLAASIIRSKNFNREDRDDKFLRRIDNHLQDYTVSQPIRRHSAYEYSQLWDLTSQILNKQSTTALILLPLVAYLIPLLPSERRMLGHANGLAFGVLSLFTSTPLLSNYAFHIRKKLTKVYLRWLVVGATFCVMSHVCVRFYSIPSDSSLRFSFKKTSVNILSVFYMWASLIKINFTAHKG